MKKAAMSMITAFAVMTIMTVPFVAALPTQSANSNNFVSFIWHSENGIQINDEGYPEVNPPWAVNPGPDVQVIHNQFTWQLNPSKPNYIKIGEGSTITIDSITGYEGYGFIQTVVSSPTYQESNYRVYEKIMWSDNYIEIMKTERATLDLGSGGPPFSGSGTFVGHGIIDGQKVQVTGIVDAYNTPPRNLMLDSIGVIRFLGNSP